MFPTNQAISIRTTQLITSVLTAAMLSTGCADGMTPTAPTGGVSSSLSAPGGTGEPAMSAADTSSTHTSFPVAFSLAGGTCGLTTTVSATGVMAMKVHTVATPNGTLRVTINAQANGTGTGADGSRYTFSYNQTFIQENAAIDPIPVKATDVFQLVGLGGAPSVHTLFVVTAELSGGQFSNLEFKANRGNPFGGCDPL
jgi:hypothetical protein